MKRKFALLLSSTMVFVSVSANAIILERYPQGTYNTKQTVVVDESLAEYTRYVDMTAPRANTLPTHKVYTYDNAVSEYLRDNLNLPKMEANYAMQATSYLKTPAQIDRHNSTWRSLEADTKTEKEKLKEQLK